MTWILSLLRRRERLAVPEEVGEGLVNLASRRGGFGALVEVAELLRVELEKIQPIEVQPLVDEAAYELVGLGAGNEAVDFAGEGLGIGEIGLEQGLVGRRAPEEVGEAGGKLRLRQGDGRGGEGETLPFSDWLMVCFTPISWM